MGNNKPPKYLLPLIHAFEKNANADAAIGMEKYMRNQFKFFGIPSPKRKEIYKDFKNEYGLISDKEKNDVIHWCWEEPQREYQMFAMEFLSKSAKNENEEVIQLYEYMIVTKSWWDTIDFIASNLVGEYFRKYPEFIPIITTKWMMTGNIWLQRTCLLFQLKYKSKLNKDLLVDFIKPLASSNEFFIQKAIGWILREYSKTDTEFVIKFVNINQLSNLSKREALLWMRKKGIIDTN